MARALLCAASMRTLVSSVSFASLVLGSLLVIGCSSATDTSDTSGTAGASNANDGNQTVSASSASSIARIALANVGKSACSTNSEGGRFFESSCTGNGGEPEYWCADFARWVWAEAGVETSGLSAAAGSFYTYGASHGTLHSTPSVGDAVVFNYEGGGYASHVAIVTQVNSNGTIESVSGDWDGERGSEATFSRTSRVVENTAYESREGDVPSTIGMKISGYISPVGSGAVAGGGSGVGGSSGSGSSHAASCYSSTLAKTVAHDACVETSAGHWYQCDNGSWTDRFSDPEACSSISAR